MLTLMLLIFLQIPEQSSQVVISTGVAGAEFYLDGNFVATTDKNGMLTMENFPAGSFNYTLKKPGHETRNGSFTVREGEVKRLQPVFEKIKSPPGQERKPAAPHDERSERPRSITAPVRVDPNPVPPPNPPPGFRPAETPLGNAPEGIPEPSSLSLPALALLCVVVLSTLGIWIWKKKGDAPDIKPVEPVPELTDPEPQEIAANRPEPPFIEELKRREELMNAGFVANQPRAFSQDGKEKEVVIVLPKEAFRYEEDK
jgi:hypothetical protein